MAAILRGTSNITAAASNTDTTAAVAAFDAFYATVLEVVDAGFVTRWRDPLTALEIFSHVKVHLLDTIIKPMNSHTNLICYFRMYFCSILRGRPRMRLVGLSPTKTSI